MKKCTSFLVLVFLFTAYYSEAQSPIPSWSFPVYPRANFQETANGTPGLVKNTRGKRTMHIQAQGTVSPRLNCGTLWVYCIESLEVVGPFQLCAGETLTVEIDERTWGVYIESESSLVVDVWIE